MASRLYRYAIISITLVLAGTMLSCGGKSLSSETESVQTKSPKTIETEAHQDAPVLAVTTALITFLSGDVILYTSGEERYPDIGDEIAAGDRLSTGADGYAELQIGDLGAVRIQSETEYTLESLQLSEDGSRYSGTLSAGSIIAKVRTMTDRDSFEVNVPGAVCAVRGTEFLIHAERTGEITVAVSEGSVAVAPPSLAQAPADPMQAQLAEVRAMVPVVPAGEEVVLAQESMAEAEQVISEWKASVSGESTVTELTDQNRALIQDALSNHIELQTITQENTVLIEETAPEILPVALTASTEAASGQEASQPELSVLTVTTDPASAEIFINGAASGRGKAERVFPLGMEINIRAVSADGTVSERNIVSGAESIVELKLEALEEETPEENGTPQTNTALETEETSILVTTVKTTPNRAVIAVNGSAVGNGSAEISGSEGDRVLLEVSLPGYQSVTQRLTLSESTVPLEIELEPKLIAAKTSLPAGPAVGTPVGSGNVAVFASNDGGLFAMNRNGRITWSAATANGAAEKTSPLIAGGKVYVTGNTELVVLNLNNGAIVAREGLSGDRADLFGRRPAVHPSGIILPSDSAIVLLDPSTVSDIKSTPIPQGSQASPSVWNGRVLIVDQRGTLLAVDPNTGSIVQTVDTASSQPIAGAPAIESGIAVFSGRKGIVTAVDLGSMSVLWEASLGSGGVRVHSSAEVDDGTVYIYGENTVYAFDLQSGSERFAPVSGVSAPPMADGGRLYLCMETGSMSVMDGRSGSVFGSVPLGEMVKAKPIRSGSYILVGGNRSAFVVDPRSFLE